MIAGAVCALLAVGPVGDRPGDRRECAFDLWDWTAPCADLDQFARWADDLRGIGFTTIEISAPWRLLEPKPGEYDLSFIGDRLRIAQQLGLSLRVRINSYYAGATPLWLECDKWVGPDGGVAMDIPSIDDPRFWARYAPLCTAISRTFRGRDTEYSPFISVHSELKWSEWWTYDESSLRLWRRCIAAPRPDWLVDAVGDGPLPERPPVPGPTEGEPDSDPANIAFIAFRERCWREAVARFVSAIREGDPDARIAVPLGESYRSASATMSNLDYRGLSRGATRVVHSYDFFWHASDDPWYAAATVAIFRGITGLPVSLELDGPNLRDQWGYTDQRLASICAEGLRAGASQKVANYSYSTRLPSEWPLLGELSRQAREAGPVPGPAPADETILYFVSKWTNYRYRESTEWVHDAQLGAWRALTERGHRLRAICEDNLDEPDLASYRGVYVAFSPESLMPVSSRAELTRLCEALPSILETPTVPPKLAGNAPVAVEGRWAGLSVTSPGLPVGPCDVRAGYSGWRPHARSGDLPLLLAHGPHVVIGYPIGYCSLRADDRERHAEALEWAVRRAFSRK